MSTTFYLPSATVTRGLNMSLQWRRQIWVARGRGPEQTVKNCTLQNMSFLSKDHSCKTKSTSTLHQSLCDHSWHRYWRSLWLCLYDTAQNTISVKRCCQRASDTPKLNAFFSVFWAQRWLNQLRMWLRYYWKHPHWLRDRTTISIIYRVPTRGETIQRQVRAVYLQNWFCTHQLIHRHQTLMSSKQYIINV